MSRFASATWRPFHSSLEHTKRFSAATFPTRALRFNVHSSYSPQRTLSISHDRQDLPVSGLEDEFVGYVFGKKKATDVAHSVWKHVVRKGDTVIDATCGNGHDTLALLRLVADKSARGLVYGMDIQEDALYSTHYLLGQSFSSEELDHVELFPLCHSKMEEIIPKGTSVRLVAFNLGYLPGGDKAITTRSATTLLALEAAGRIVEPGGLISTMVYVGHPGGREEFETVQAFAAGLSTENWVCCKLEMLNRPLAPIPIFMFKR